MNEATPTPMARIGTYALAAVIGVIYGAVATMGHRQEIRIGELVTAPDTG